METLARVLAGSALAIGMTMACAADLPPPRYEVKQEIPSTGTRIPRKAVWSSQLPVNRRYAELTPEEQATVKSAYEPMLPFDEPPFPVDGLAPVFAAVRDVGNYVRVQGDLSIFVEVDDKGDAVSASVMKSPDPKLAQAVGAVLLLTKFKPAVCRGAPCRMGYPFRMHFAVEH